MQRAQRLLHKTAIVTGGAKGIGLAVAQALGAEGAAVVVSDVDDAAAGAAVQALTAQGIAARYTRCDVSRKDQVESLVASTVESLGGIDILVANAGASSAAVRAHTAVRQVAAATGWALPNGCSSTWQAQQPQQWQTAAQGS